MRTFPVVIAILLYSTSFFNLSVNCREEDDDGVIIDNPFEFTGYLNDTFPKVNENEENNEPITSQIPDEDEDNEPGPILVNGKFYVFPRPSEENSSVSEIPVVVPEDSGNLESSEKSGNSTVEDSEDYESSGDSGNPGNPNVEDSEGSGNSGNSESSEISTVEDSGNSGNLERTGNSENSTKEDSEGSGISGNSGNSENSTEEDSGNSGNLERSENSENSEISTEKDSEDSGNLERTGNSENSENPTIIPESEESDNEPEIPEVVPEDSGNSEIPTIIPESEESDNEPEINEPYGFPTPKPAEVTDSESSESLEDVKDLPLLQFLRALLSLYKIGGYSRRNPIARMILSQSDISDDVYRTLIASLRVTRKELRSGDGSVRTMNALIWLNTRDKRIRREVLDIAHLILKERDPKPLAFSLGDVSRDIAHARIERQRLQGKPNKKEKREINQKTLNPEVLELEPILRLDVTRALPDMSAQTAVQQSIHDLLVFFVNKIYDKMSKINSTQELEEFFLETVELALQQSEVLVKSVGIEEDYHWRDTQRQPIRNIFHRAIELANEKIHGDAPLVIPEATLSEEQFLEHIREALEEEKNTRVELKLEKIAEKLSKILRESTLVEHLDIGEDLTQIINDVNERYKKMYIEVREHPEPFHGAPRGYGEKEDEIIEDGVEMLVEAVRDRFQETKPVTSKPSEKVLKFLKDWYASRDYEVTPEFISQLAHSRDVLGDANMQKIGEFFEQHLEYKSRLESLDWLKILRGSYGTDLAKMLQEFERIANDFSLPHRSYNFIDEFERCEMDREETRQLVEALQPVLELNSSAKSLGVLLEDLSRAQSSEEFEKVEKVSVNLYNFTAEAVDETIKKYRRLDVWNSRIFSEFLHNIAIVLSRGNLSSEDLGYFLKSLAGAKGDVDVRKAFTSLARFLAAFGLKSNELLDGKDFKTPDEEVAAAWEALKENQKGEENTEFLREYMNKYENGEEESKHVQRILESFGIDTKAIEHWNKVTTPLDQLANLLEAAGSYPNLQRLLQFHERVTTDQLDPKMSEKKIEDLIRRLEGEVSPPTYEEFEIERIYGDNNFGGLTKSRWYRGVGGRFSHFSDESFQMLHRDEEAEMMKVDEPMYNPPQSFGNPKESPKRAYAHKLAHNFVDKNSIHLTGLDSLNDSEE